MKYDRRVTEALILKQRVAAAIANNPNIAPRHLAEQTGLTIAQAIAELEARR